MLTIVVIHSNLEPGKSGKEKIVQLVFQFVLISFYKIIIVRDVIHVHP